MGIKKIELNIFLTVFIIVVSNILFILTANYDILGWYLVPIDLCGIIIVYELLKYIRGDYNLFEPRGLIALVGTHYYYISPLLFLSFSRNMFFVNNPEDWGKWVGILSLLNFIGLVIYKIIVSKSDEVKNTKIRTYWTINKKRFLVWFIILAGISFLFQSYVLITQGGISGIIQSKTEGTLDLSGKGWMLMIGESFPILLFIGIFILLVKSSSQLSTKSRIFIYIILALFFVFQLLVAGMRGSRSTTIFALFWCVVIIHYTWKPFMKKHLIIGISFIMAFMVFYGFYKNVGSEVGKVITGEVSFQTLQEENENRGLINTLTSSISRVDIQSFLLYRLFDTNSDYEVAYGRTYIGDIAILIPSFILPNSPPTKVKEGTELMYGENSYVPGVFESSRVYGILGEGLLNFHVFSLPLVFSVWSLFALFVTRLIKVLPRDDSRWLILPLLIQLTFTSVNSDLDNIVFGLVKTGFMPFLLILLSSNIKKNKGEEGYV